MELAVFARLHQLRHHVRLPQATAYLGRSTIVVSASYMSLHGASIANSRCRRRLLLEKGNILLDMAGGDTLYIRFSVDQRGLYVTTINMDGVAVVPIHFDRGTAYVFGVVLPSTWTSRILATAQAAFPRYRWNRVVYMDDSNGRLVVEDRKQV